MISMDNDIDISMDDSMMDLADVFASIKVTGFQKDMILWFFEENLDVLTNPSGEFDDILNGMICLKILLCKYGRDYSIQEWCQYWISWHQAVVEKYAAQYMSCAGFFESDKKALQLIFRVNSLLNKPFDLDILKVSPLVEFVSQLGSYIEPEYPEDEREDSEVHPNFVVSLYTGEESYVYKGNN